ncbi:MAG TPA: selenium-binding family protein [Pirellulales bacterium]|nr:selenium-binding family protein [Pirellulales bacterium]
MQRREFLAAAASVGLAAEAFAAGDKDAPDKPAVCGTTYASPQAASQSPREKLLYVTALYVGTDGKQPDYLATVDVEPGSPNYSKVVHRLAMPNVGDELHHFGWNACSSCHGDPEKSRRFLVVPGLLSGRIHILDAADPAAPKLHKVIEPEQIAEKVNFSAPHTVHCLPNGDIMVSMLGDGQRNAPGGFLLLDQEFEIAGHWEEPGSGMKFNYDFWYQPRQNVMVTSEWAAPKTFEGGFQAEDVEAGKYGSRIHFWDWKERRLNKTFDLGIEGRIPLEVRFHHDPDSTHGFVGAALSSSVWHWHRDADAWQVEKVIQVEPVEKAGWPFPVPGLITDLVLSLDDRFLYFSNWLHGDIRQYDMRNPGKPRLVGQIWLGGVLGRLSQLRGRKVTGGPQMLQLSLDGKRLYVTNSLYSAWDNQFYPDMVQRGSYLVQIDCDTHRGGLTINHDFFVDFGHEPGGPARAHEMHFPGGDCTSDIWV